MKEFLESANLLQTITAEAAKNRETARELVAGLSEDQLNWTPDPKRWSIAQCLDHLATTSKGFRPYLTAAIEKGRSQFPAPQSLPYRPSWVGGWLAKQVMPETTRKVPSPKVFKPSYSRISNPLEIFLDQQNEFLDFVRQANGLDYNKIRLRSPVTSLMRYSLADAFVVTVLHERRHLGQAQRVRDTPGFPA